MWSKEGPVTFARHNLKAQGITCMSEVVLYVHYSWVVHILYVHYSWVLYIYIHNPAIVCIYIYIYIYIYIKSLELEPSPSSCYQCTEPAVIVSLHNLNNLQLIVPY